MNKKLLFLCTTEFQLMTALNIKYHMYPEREADIIVDNYHGEEKALAKRIRDTNIFDRVMYVRSEVEEKTLHRYARNLVEGKGEVSLLDAVRNMLSFLNMKCKIVFQGRKAWLRTMITDFDQLDPMEYEIFFSCGGKHSTRNLAPYMHEKNPMCKMAELDEGIGSYRFPCIANGDVEHDCTYLYNPKLLQEREITAVRIPKLSSDDVEFVKRLNHVFLYRGMQRKTVRNKVIFFDDGVAMDMPLYLKKHQRSYVCCY